MPDFKTRPTVNGEAIVLASEQKVAPDLVGEDRAHSTPSFSGSGTARKVLTIDDAGVVRAEWLMTYDVFNPSEFVFDVSSFSVSGAGGTRLIGTGSWMTGVSGSVNYQAPGDPVDGASVSLQTGSGTGFPVTLDSPYTAFNAPSNTIDYPANVGGQVRLLLSASAGAENDTRTVTTTFYNYRMWGTLPKSSGFTASDIDAVQAQNAQLSNSISASYTATAGTGEYEVYVLRSALGAPNSLTLGGFGAAPIEADTVSWTNPAGFTENYTVWLPSSQQNTGGQVVAWS